METVLKPTNLSITADAHLMEQVLINLVLNAIEAVKDEALPLITLSAAPDGLRTEIRVSDNGRGIPENILDKIFVPFFSTRKKGTGIGLSICKQIVLLHKGTLRVRSREGEGTVFVISMNDAWGRCFALGRCMQRPNNPPIFSIPLTTPAPGSYRHHGQHKEG